MRLVIVKIGLHMMESTAFIQNFERLCHLDIRTMTIESVLHPLHHLHRRGGVRYMAERRKSPKKVVENRKRSKSSVENRKREV